MIFSLSPLLPDHPPAEELQELVTSLFMSGFVKLGKIFDLNRSFDMWLIDKVFQGVGKGTASCTRSIRCASAMYPSRTTRKTCRAIPFYAVPKCGICEKARSDAGAAAFLQSDYWGMSQLHGTLIRRGTCGNADRCDYCVVRSENSMAKEYEIIKDEAGFLVSRKIEK